MLAALFALAAEEAEPNQTAFYVLAGALTAFAVVLAIAPALVAAGRDLVDRAGAVHGGRARGEHGPEPVRAGVPRAPPQNTGRAPGTGGGQHVPMPPRRWFGTRCRSDGGGSSRGQSSSGSCAVGFFARRYQ